MNPITTTAMNQHQKEILEKPQKTSLTIQNQSMRWQTFKKLVLFV